VLARRSSAALRCALAGTCALAALAALRAAPHAYSAIFIDTPLGPRKLLPLLELGALLAVALPLAWAADLPSRVRPAWIWLGVAAGVLAVLSAPLLVHAPGGHAKLSPTLSAHALSVDGGGGGYTAAGLRGEYFANADLADPPAFVRHDVRVDLDWGKEPPPPGGSTNPAFAAVSGDRFSVRWTGHVVARFSEAYVFALDADDGARLWLRDAQSGAWTLVIDGWAGSGAHTSAPVAMRTGTPVEIKLEYRQLGGPARVRLSWSSPSTPSEVIEPLSTSGVNVDGYLGYLGSALWADAIKGGRYQWTGIGNDTRVEVDADGWPLHDASNITIEGAHHTRGTYALSFSGSAEVSVFPRVAFEVDGSTFDGVLPKGTGYDASANVTRARMRLDEDASILYLNFRQTQRSRSAAQGSGVRDVHLMRPVSPGSRDSYAPGTLFDRGVSAFFAGFTTLRWILNFDSEAHWRDRIGPNQAKVLRESDPANWENVVMLANETGRDLYICTPINADDDYITKLARLCRFGSDARGEPYTAAQRTPVHPPLNPNLRVYVERSNEVWNWGFRQAQENVRQVRERSRARARKRRS
jgi:hypothetical protein